MGEAVLHALLFLGLSRCLLPAESVNMHDSSRSLHTCCWQSLSATEVSVLLCKIDRTHMHQSSYYIICAVPCSACTHIPEAPQILELFLKASGYSRRFTPSIRTRCTVCHWRGPQVVVEMFGRNLFFALVSCPSQPRLFSVLKLVSRPQSSLPWATHNISEIHCYFNTGEYSNSVS